MRLRVVYFISSCWIYTHIPKVPLAWHLQNVFCSSVFFFFHSFHIRMGSPVVSVTQAKNLGVILDSSPHLPYPDDHQDQLILPQFIFLIPFFPFFPLPPVSPLSLTWTIAVMPSFFWQMLVGSDVPGTGDTEANKTWQLPQKIDRLVLICLLPSRLTIFKSVIHTDTTVVYLTLKSFLLKTLH